MKKFNFKMQSVLKYRKFLEKKAKQELGLAIMKLNKCEKKIKGFQNSFALQRTLLDKEMENGINSSRYRIATNYLAGLHLDIRREKKEAFKLNENVFIKRKKLTEKQIEKKLIDKLKEKKHQEYYQNLMKVEQKEIDDMVIIKRINDQLKKNEI